MSDATMTADEILDAGAREVERCGLHRGGFAADSDDGDSPVCGMGAMRRVALGHACGGTMSDGPNVGEYLRAEKALAAVMVEQLGVPPVYVEPLRYAVGGFVRTDGSFVGEPKSSFDVVKEGNDEYAKGAADVVACMKKAAAGLR